MIYIYDKKLFEDDVNVLNLINLIFCVLYYII